MSASAITIYQEFLDDMGEALISRDADAFVRRIFLPHAIITEDDTVEFDTRAAARQHFEGFSGALAAQGVDDYTRVARAARFESDTHIVGQHDSFMSSGGKLVVPPFSNEMEIILRDGIWGATKIQHKARYVKWPHVLPRSSGASNAD
ncbi:hypothetical protein [Gymnodinialimonas sp.]